MKKHLLLRIMFIALAWLAGAASAAWAQQPPALIQFQGRLTNSSGAPLTGAQTVFFSLWQGGTDTSANSGTQFYSEQAAITPDANGVFDHPVGSGTTLSGTIVADKFNTNSPVYLQIAVGSTGNVLLPRTRLTSVGYAMMAGVAAYAAQSGGVTSITSVTDATGGLLVIGDLVRIKGSNLASAQVQVSGLPAPVKSQSSGEIVFQVPAGTPQGLNTVALTQGTGNGAPLAFTTIDVHRLIIAIAPISRFLYVLDERDGSIVTTITPPTSFDSNLLPIQIGFASQGALALIPGNKTGMVMALDLTANPPAIVATDDPGLGTAVAVSVSPDNKVAVISDPTLNRLTAVALNEQMPPFTSNYFSSLTYNLIIPSLQNGPRGSTFIGDQLLLVCFQNSGTVVGYRRNPAKPLQNYQFIDRAVNVEDRPTLTAVGQTPFWIKPLPDLTQVLLLTRDQTNLQVRFVDPKGLSDPQLAPAGLASAGGAVQNVSFSRVDGLLLSANQGTQNDQAETRNRINIFNLVGNSLQRISSLEGFNHNPVADKLFVTLVMDPVDGRAVAVSTTYGSIIFTRRTGGTLSYFTDPVGGLSKTFDLEVDLPNIGREFVPIMEIQP